MNKERKTSIKAFYFPNGKEYLREELEELKWNRRMSVNAMIIEAVEDYVKTHTHDNLNFTIDQFQDESFKACPAFYRNNTTWTEYLLTIKDDKVQSKEFDEHLGMLLRTWNDVFSGRIKKHD